MVTCERECVDEWPANECKVRPVYLQQMVAERKVDKPKKTRKEKEYDLMKPIYISTPRAYGRI